MRVVVVGSGIGGLLAGAQLARAGVDVVRIERAENAGGRGRSPLLGGVPVNLGPRALYRGGPLEKALSALGIRPAGFAPKTPGTRVVFGDDVRVLPTSVAELLASDVLRGADKRALALSFARIAVGALDVEPDESVAAWLERRVSTPDARALIRMLIRIATYSNDGAHDASLALAQTRRALARGVRYLDGGWENAVVAPLVDVNERAGVRTEHRTVRALDDLDADAVIVALPYAEARALLPHLPETAPVAVACLDVVLARLPRPDVRVAFGVDRPTYFSVHARADTTGPMIAHAMVCLAPHAGAAAAPSNAGAAAARADLEAVVDAAQPGWRDVVVEARYLPHMIVASLPRAGVARIPVRVDERTFLVGDGVDAGALLADNVAASARAAVDEVLARAKVRGAAHTSAAA